MAMTGAVLQLVLFIGICSADGGPAETDTDVDTSNHTTYEFGGKIVGGQKVDISAYPYQVYLLLQIGNDYYQCGGSIIKANRILTAAHCMQGVSTTYVVAGSSNHQDGATMVKASRYVVNPRYNPQTFSNDVALIFLGSDLPINGKTIAVVKLPAENSDVQPGTIVTASGWGTTSENGNTSDDLMAVSVPVVSRQQCEKAYGANTIGKEKICAGEGGKDSCQGDSGGPLVTKSGTVIQVGIVSYGNGCARPGVPGVYTNVGAVRRFITSVGGV